MPPTPDPHRSPRTPAARRPAMTATFSRRACPPLHDERSSPGSAARARPQTPNAPRRRRVREPPARGHPPHRPANWSRTGLQTGPLSAARSSKPDQLGRRGQRPRGQSSSDRVVFMSSFYLLPPPLLTPSLLPLHPCPFGRPGAHEAARRRHMSASSRAAAPHEHRHACLRASSSRARSTIAGARTNSGRTPGLLLPISPVQRSDELRCQIGRPGTCREHVKVIVLAA